MKISDAAESERATLPVKKKNLVWAGIEPELPVSKFAFASYDEDISFSRSDFRIPAGGPTSMMRCSIAQ